jgi:hypothetical protein
MERQPKIYEYAGPTPFTQWLNVQNYIHDYLTADSARFDYPDFRISLSLDAEVKAKYK